MHVFSRSTVRTFINSLFIVSGVTFSHHLTSQTHTNQPPPTTELDIAERLDDYNQLKLSTLKDSEHLSPEAIRSLDQANAAAEESQLLEASENLDDASFFIFKNAVANYPLTTKAKEFFQLGLLSDEMFEGVLTQKIRFFTALHLIDTSSKARNRGLRFITTVFLWDQFLALLQQKLLNSETNSSSEEFDQALTLVYAAVERLTAADDLSKPFNTGDQKPYLEISKRAIDLVSEKMLLLKQREEHFISRLENHRAFARKTLLAVTNDPLAESFESNSGNTRIESSGFSNTQALGDLQKSQLQTFQLALGYFEQKCESCSAEDTELIRKSISRIKAMPTRENFRKEAELIKTLVDKNSTIEMNQKGSAQVLANFAPDRVVLKNIDALMFLKSQIPSVRKEYLKRSSTYQKLFVRDKKQSLKALDLLEKTINSTLNKVKYAEDIDYNVQFADRWKPHFIALSRCILEAVMSHSHQSLSYAEVLYETMNRVNSKSQNFFTMESLKSIRSLNDSFSSDEIFRAWINTDNIALGALSALLATEAILAVPSFGTSLAAMPYTSAAIAAISIGARSLMIANSAFRINDRYTYSGTSGLLNVETAIDSLIILTMLPRVPILAKPAQPTSLPLQGSLASRSAIGLKNLLNYSQHLIKTIPYRASQHIMAIQYAGTSLLTFTAGTYGSYQALFAESIAKELQEQGVNVSATEIRRNGLRNLVTSLISYTANRAFLKTNFSTKPVTTGKFMVRNQFSQSFLASRLKGALNPLQAAKSFYAKSSLSVPLKALGSSMVLAAYGLYDYVVLSEAVLFSYTSLDSRYMNKSLETNPLPDLREGESALGLVGFDEEDFILYLGSHAKHSHRSEIKKFGLNYAIEDFSSPDHFIEKIKHHSKVHGPIRYLKIMTHGKPGVLYTQFAVSGDAVGVESNGPKTDPADLGWINSEWLVKYGEKIKSAARDAFAPDARIVLFACLVGSNLDYLEKDELPEPSKDWNLYEKKLAVGDTFLSDLGDKLLVNGGRIDASTRILAGLDVSYGSALKAFASNGEKIDLERPLVPLVDLERPLEIEEGALPIQNHQDLLTSSDIRSVTNRIFYLTHQSESEESFQISEFDSSPSVWDRASYLGSRAKSLLPAIPKLIAKYGIQLEGPWWQNRYKTVEVQPHN